MIAIIPARGGSKGLPDKNIRPLRGKPLIAYSVEAALGSKYITRTIVSTDSESIARAGREAGAEVPFMRPAELATDTALALDNYVYTIERLRKEGAQVDEIVVLLPTAPLRNAKDVDAAIDIFREKQADSVISYYKAPHPVQWYRYLDDQGVLRSVMAEGDRLANRQAERQTYLPNGAIYVFKADVLVKQRAYYTDRTYPYLMEAERSVDIDTLFDFRLAEFLMSEQTR